ncbi:MAG: hypothetical protein RLZZ244_596 [Verrucomicrobiota bacterium]|jgi:cytosine/adenosine deaminase-related metal-dependent hydrolase
MIIRARIVLPMSGPPLRDGWVQIRGDRIAAVGSGLRVPAEGGEETVDLGEHVLLPGLINAHCHLDYSVLKHAISPPKGFTEWVRRLNSVKRQMASEDILASVARGFEECMTYGTTSVCTMVAFPELLGRIPPPPIRTWWFYEMIDIRHRNATEEVVAGALSFFDHQADPSDLSHYGLNPHAPYTASLLLYRLARRCAETHGSLLLTTHVSESAEESEMFRLGSGALYDFLRGLERPMHDCGLDTPFGWLWRNGAIGPGWILAHLNELETSDFNLLGSLSPEELPHIVHCPGSHRYFGHRPFPLAKLAGMGVNVCVGTDSLASTDSLSLLEELRRVRAAHPGLGAADLLSMVTLGPAKALRREGELGCLQTGAFADLIGVPLKGAHEGEAGEAVLAHQGRISWMMVGGKSIPLPSK